MKYSLTILLLIAQLSIKIGTCLCATQRPEPLEAAESVPLTPPQGSISPELEATDEISREEAEAFLEIEQLLSSMSERVTEDGGYRQLLEDLTEGMREILATNPDRAETSQSGAIRGYSSGLMRDLIFMYQQAALCKEDELSRASERLGSKSVLIEKQLDIQLTHLNKYLAALFYACQEGCQQGRNSGAIEPTADRKEHRNSDSEDNWLNNVIKWIGS